jgi:AMP nucleosidase
MVKAEDFYHETEQQRQFALETLERYSGSKIDDFQPWILLTNFPRYVDYFATKYKCKIQEGSMFKTAHSPKEGVSILDFKIGSPAAALVMDLCAFLPCYAMILLGMCGGLREDYEIGEYFVPVAAIRGDATSDFYFPPEVPAMANFTVQKEVSAFLEKKKIPYHIGITHTTNKRFWEFNPEFRKRLKETRPQVVEMECATLFAASYSHRLPLGSLLLISDLPIKPAGYKTKKSSEMVFAKYMGEHVDLGVAMLKQLAKVPRLKEYRQHVH